jgi:hypothetical protein
MNAIPPDSAAADYLLTRGVALEFAVSEGGALWRPERGGTGREILSFPLYGNDGKFFDKFLPVTKGKKDRGFRNPRGCNHPIYISARTWEARKDSTQAIFATEGPVKSVALLQEGCLSIGLIGTWMSEKVAGSGAAWKRQVQLLQALRQFEWRNREVFFAFDADQWRKTGVRHSVIRNYLLLAQLGAKVRCLLWDEDDGKKGIDDYLVKQENPTEALQELIEEARGKEFISSVERADLRLVEKELRRVRMGKPDFTYFTKEFASRFKVNRTDFGKYPRDRVDDDESNEQTGLFRSVKPWEDEVNGEELLEEIIRLILKHVYITPERALAVALWILWTYFVHEDFVEKSPFLGITGADKRVGKSRLLDLIAKLVRKTYSVGRLSEAALYRLIQEHKPTLLIDEFHRLLSRYPNLLDLLLTSYDRDKKVVLVNVESHTLDEFDCWAAKAFAYLGTLDEQLRDRIIEIYLERKPRKVRRARLKETLPEDWETVTRKCLRWAADNKDAVAAVKVAPLDVSNDRASDNWELLLAIAEVIDPAREVTEGESTSYSTQIRSFALAEEGDERDEESEGPQVLKILRRIFKEECETKGVDFDDPKTDLAISLKDLCEALNREEIAPWKNDKWHGWNGEVTSQWLAKVMRHYRIKAIQLRAGEKRGTRCYVLKQLRKSFDTLEP